MSSTRATLSRNPTKERVEISTDDQPAESAPRSLLMMSVHQRSKLTEPVLPWVYSEWRGKETTICTIDPELLVQTQQSFVLDIRGPDAASSIPAFVDSPIQ